VGKYYYGGGFKKIRPHYEGTWTAVSGMPGAEDVTISSKNGMAFVSSYDRRAYRAGLETRGAIYELDYKVKGTLPRSLTEGFEGEFHPHGFGLYQDPSGREFLFAANVTKKGDVVEIFEYVDGILEHRETVMHPLMWAPNDVLGVSPNRFYATNDHGCTSSIGSLLEDFIPLRRSYVVYYDGKEMRRVAEGIAYANGINMSADGTTVYVASVTGKCIHVFNRDAASGALMPKFTIPLGSFPDNIEVDASGALYVACHPKIFTYLAHKSNGQKHAPSQVLKVTIRGEKDYEVEEIYLDDGKNIDAATVAAPFDGGMILGPSKDLRHQVLICANANKAESVK
jgi:arylesterase/paraoxonase